MKLTFSVIFCAALLVLAAPVATAGTISSMQQYSLIVFGDLDNNSNIHGKTFVGGSLTGMNSHDFAINIPGTPGSEVTVRVGGNINAGNPLNVNAGSVEVGGTINRPINLNGGAGATATAGLPQDISTIQAELESASLGFAALMANSSANLVGNQLTFEAAPDGPLNRAVFQVSAANIFSNPAVANIDINLNGASEVVINVSGASADFNQGNMLGNFALNSTREKVLWNFYEATSIETFRRLDGSLLAPLAHLTINQNVEGSVAVASMTQRAEVHFPVPTITPDPNFIPEPHALSLALMGAFAMLTRRGRR
jgi:choice-of-anchor A domain-containing protein